MAQANIPSKFNSVYIGLFAGLLIPVISVTLFYYTAFSKVPFSFFLKYAHSIDTLGKMISVGAVPNLGLFFLFMSKNHILSARGVILATLILAIGIIILNFVL